MRIGVTATALAAFVTFGGTATAQTSGYVGAGYGQQDVDFGGSSVDGDATLVEGAVNIPTAGAWNVQLDASYIDVSDFDASATSLTGHLVNRNSSRAFGGFLGYSDAENSSTWIGGGEYAKFFANSTLALGAGYATNDDVDIDAYGVNGEYRLFASNNLRFDGRLGWQNVDGSGADADAFNYGVGAEWRFEELPISLYGTYDIVDVSDFDIEVDTFKLGVRYQFGATDLKTQDNEGTTFKSLGGFADTLLAFSF